MLYVCADFVVCLRRLCGMSAQTMLYVCARTLAVVTDNHPQRLLPKHGGVSTCNGHPSTVRRRQAQLNLGDRTAVIIEPALPPRFAYKQDNYFVDYTICT